MCARIAISSTSPAKQGIRVSLWDESQDWEMLKPWFLAAGGAPHVSQLPPLGLIAWDDEGALGAIWVYQSVGVGVCFPEWFICRPDAGPFQKLAAARQILNSLERLMTQEDYQLLRIAILDERIARIAQRRFGFVDVGPKVHYLLKKLN